MRAELGAPIAGPCNVAGCGPPGLFHSNRRKKLGLASSGYMSSKHQPSQPASVRRENQTGAQAQFGALLMTDGGTQRSGPPSLFHGLTESEIAQVLGSGKRR